MRSTASPAGTTAPNNSSCTLSHHWNPAVASHGGACSARDDHCRHAPEPRAIRLVAGVQQPEELVALVAVVLPRVRELPELRRRIQHRRNSGGGLEREHHAGGARSLRPAFAGGAPAPDPVLTLLAIGDFVFHGLDDDLAAP